jgi:hypothetical protein
VHNQPVEVILASVKAGGIAIPEIQRPFVWDAVHPCLYASRLSPNRKQSSERCLTPLRSAGW